jgi:hypothetical protein
MVLNAPTRCSRKFSKIGHDLRPGRRHFDGRGRAPGECSRTFSHTVVVAGTALSNLGETKDARADLFGETPSGA